MNWLQFFTILAQVFIGAAALVIAILVIGAAASVMYNNFKDKK